MNREQTTLRLPPDKLRQILKTSAKARGITMNALILQILWAWVEEQRSD